MNNLVRDSILKALNEMSQFNCDSFTFEEISNKTRLTTEIVKKEIEILEKEEYLFQGEIKGLVTLLKKEHSYVKFKSNSFLPTLSTERFIKLTLSTKLFKSDKKEVKTQNKEDELKKIQNEIKKLREHLEIDSEEVNDSIMVHTTIDGRKRVTFSTEISPIEWIEIEKPLLNLLGYKNFMKVQPTDAEKNSYTFKKFKIEFDDKKLKEFNEERFRNKQLKILNYS